MGRRLDGGIDLSQQHFQVAALQPGSGCRSVVPPSSQQGQCCSYSRVLGAMSK